MAEGRRGFGHWPHQDRLGLRRPDRLLADEVIMKRLLLLSSLVALLAASTRFVGAQQPGTTPRFTGKTEVMDGKDLSVARRSFEAGARTAWHSHDNGQLLLVEKGRMRAQKRGQPVKE